MFHLSSLISLLFLLSFVGDQVLAGGQNSLFKTSLEAAKNKQCLGDYNGEVTMKHKIVSSCFAGGFVEEVHIHPCAEGSCDRVSPVARVVYNCDVSKPRVKCL